MQVLVAALSEQVQHSIPWGDMMIEWYLAKNEQLQKAEQSAKLGNGWRLRSISMHGAAADPSFAAVWVQASGPVQTVVICDIAKLDHVIEDAAKNGTHPTLVTGVGNSRSVCRVLVVFEPGTRASVVGPWTKLWFDPGDLLADDGEAGIKMRAGNSCAGLIAVRDGADTYVRALWVPSDPQRAPLQWFEVDRQDRLNEAVQVMRPHRARLLNTFLVSDPPQRIMLWDDPAFEQVHTFGNVAHDVAQQVAAEEKKGNVPLRISVRLASSSVRFCVTTACACATWASRASSDRMAMTSPFLTHIPRLILRSVSTPPVRAVTVTCLSASVRPAIVSLRLCGTTVVVATATRKGFFAAPSPARTATRLSPL